MSSLMIVKIKKREKDVLDTQSNFSFTAFGHLFKTELVNQFLSGFFLSVKQHLYILT